MEHLKIFINLTRLNKPIGFMLLFWPCSWGLAYAYNLNLNLSLNTFLYYLLIFFLGSVLMRSAGCIFNDIIDKDLDKEVKRTKQRPIAAGKISIKQSFFYIISLCALAFLILIQFNFLTIILGLGSMLLAFSYPFMKRITYWPQLFLGLTFNWGIIMAWTAINNNISYEIIVLYISAIFWTLGYDTIYGVQDVVDDEIIGVKSTAIKFKNNIKLFVSSCYLLTFSLVAYLFKENMGLNLFTLFLFMFFLSLIYQLKIFQKDNPNSCLKAFKTNNLSGLLIFLSIFFKS
ncbi:4-hydroxybenzoate octaprenyltransferase [Pelagibacterales bacterium SAG-MED29]|nr:4-hydroxybenzoate octaprenyltransferase [Pelagibacterales bacterium SAG-MED29]